MPIHIRELVVKVTVDNSASNSGGGNSGGGDQQEIIRECVEQVLEILKQEKER